MECVATDSQGQSYLFADDFAEPAEALGALMQWWAELVAAQTIISIESDPAQFVLPFYGETDVAEFLIGIVPPKTTRQR